MRIVYMGSPIYAIGPLKALLESKSHEVIAVVSQPQKPVGRNQKNLQDPPLAAYAKENGILTLQPLKARDEDFLEQLRSLSPDLIITCAYGQILTKAFLDIPKRATINIHPSLLPKYRGATPIQSALLFGEEITGVSILFTVLALDAGNIILQEKSLIHPDDTSESLFDRLFFQASQLLPKAIDCLEDKNFLGICQKEEDITLCKKIEKSMGQIIWGKTSKEITNQYRAFYSWPKSFTFFQNKRIELDGLKVFLDPIPISLEPGEFFFDKLSKSLIVKTADGFIEISSLKPEGKGLVSAVDFANGFLKKESKGLFN